MAGRGKEGEWKGEEKMSRVLWVNVAGTGLHVLSRWRMASFPGPWE